VTDRNWLSILTPRELQQTAALLHYLDRNAASCETDAEAGDPSWEDLGRALRRRASEIRKAQVKGQIVKIVELSERRLTTGDEIPVELRVVLDDDA
jgi:hypothetical protein